MKKLLAAGSGDIYYLGHVFRKGEHGRCHNPEFTMIEWYRIGMSYDAFIEETCALIMRILEQELPIKRVTYREAFQTYAGFDPFVDPIPGDPSWDRDTRLDLILCEKIEPHFEDLTVLYEYPASQAALARTDGLVAERFEIYYKSVELANGYHELTDSQEQRRRFEIENLTRKIPYPLDDSLLAALDQLPDCCGVSVGFDRLMLLRRNSGYLSEVLVR